MDYCSNQNILIVGEVDFSFSLSLAREFGTAKKMVAASLIHRGALVILHREASYNMKELEELGCTILTKFNPNTMAEHSLLRTRSFHRIIYKFPHAVFRRPECEASQIQLHKNVVRGFLQNAKHNLTSILGEIHITLKKKHLFTLWDIERLASVEGLKLVGEAEFDPALYPGYNINSGFGSSRDQSFVIGEVRTFKFSFI